MHFRRKLRVGATIGHNSFDHTSDRRGGLGWLLEPDLNRTVFGDRPTVRRWAASSSLPKAASFGLSTSQILQSFTETGRNSQNSLTRNSFTFRHTRNARSACGSLSIAHHISATDLHTMAPFNIRMSNLNPHAQSFHRGHATRPTFGAYAALSTLSVNAGSFTPLKLSASVKPYYPRQMAVADISGEVGRNVLRTCAIYYESQRQKSNVLFCSVPCLRLVPFSFVFFSSALFCLACFVFCSLVRFASRAII